MTEQVTEQLTEQMIEQVIELVEDETTKPRLIMCSEGGLN